MNVDKTVNYEIKLNEKEAESLYFMLRVFNRIIEDIPEEDIKEITNLLDFKLDDLETHQDNILTLYDNFRYAGGTIFFPKDNE